MVHHHTHIMVTVTCGIHHAGVALSSVNPAARTMSSPGINLTRLLPALSNGKIGWWSWGQVPSCFSPSAETWLRS
ncbi:uncharacterized protein LOC135105136 isoform X2 [Scylla paramamosain]|uniref:uncharacterized protein LOC135105136 isoform X2 n=1 Tax=Scylla paramamosain TaxID=85552 RepID=UPI003083CF1A